MAGRRDCACNTTKHAMAEGKVLFESSTLRGGKQLSKYAHATLGSGDLASAVRLPEGEDLCEWLAVHVVDFYNESTLLYGLIEAADTAERFPTMNAGAKCVVASPPRAPRAAVCCWLLLVFFSLPPRAAACVRHG